MGKAEHDAETQRNAERLDYMQSMLGQLRIMADSERCNMVAYLIGMAYIEVSDVIRGERPYHLQRPDEALSSQEEKGNGTI